MGPIKVFPAYIILPDEKELIVGLLPHESKHWNNKAVREKFYKNLVAHLSAVQRERCAYCGKALYITSLQTVDHVAHKEKYKEFIFEPENLVLACSLCNGFTRKGGEDVVSRYDQDYSLCQFAIVHPIRDHDKIEDHIVYSGPFPRWKTQKGRKTIELFKLDSERSIIDNSRQAHADLLQTAKQKHPLITRLLETALRAIGK